MESKVKGWGKWTATVAALMLAATLGWTQSQPGPSGAPLPATSLQAQAAPAISAEWLQKHVNYLASPEMRGRATGTKELDRAAQYVAGKFKEFGLEAGAGGSYFQKFAVTVGARLGPKNRAGWALAAGKDALPTKQPDGKQAVGAYRSLLPGQTYLPLNFSDSGRYEGKMVFAGYGITAEEYKYDDYLHLDVRDKAVIVLRNEPQKNDEKSRFDGRQPTQYSQIVWKAIHARNHGARAMVLVNDEPGPGEEDTFIKFGSLTGPDNAGILLIQARRAVVDQWLAPSNKTLSELQKAIDDKLEPQSFYMNDSTLALTVDVEKITAPTQNVVGVLRGADPKLADQAIVIGAHYDHLGLGERNSLAPAQAGQVHAGADDNASGTAALLELASELAKRQSDLRRSVVFLAFSGEELGLLGSAWYTKNPAWPLEKTAAMLNLDMVGRPRDGKLYVGGVGTSPSFRAIVDKANRTGMTLAFQESGYGSSDHTSFYVKNVPVLFFFSGLHQDYHKPSDTPEKIQPAQLARVADLAMNAALTLAASPQKPQFVRVQEPRSVAAGGGGGYGAYFGSIPDMGEEVQGVKFADVRDGSPAAKAGLKAGDVLVEFAGKEIKNLYDFTYALRAHRPGETVAVVVLRGGEKVKADVTLEVRK